MVLPGSSQFQFPLGEDDGGICLEAKSGKLMCTDTHRQGKCLQYHWHWHWQLAVALILDGASCAVHALCVSAAMGHIFTLGLLLVDVAAEGTNTEQS